MKKVYYVISFLVLSFSTALFAQEIDNNQLLWVNATTNDSLIGWPLSMTSDANANVFVCGHFEGQKGFGDFTLTTKSIDGFIVKYAPDGRVLWARQTHTPNDNVDGTIRNGHMGILACDANGNVYVMGGANTVDFGNGVSLEAPPNIPFSNSGFIVKYSPEGQPLWAKRFQSYNGGITSFKVNPNGEMYVGGSYGYIAKYNSDGNYEWSSYIKSGVMTENRIITNADNIFSVGKLIGKVEQYDGTKSASKGRADVHITKYNYSGEIDWILNYGADSSVCTPQAVAIDKKKNIYILGNFDRAIDFGNGIKLINESYTDYYSPNNYFLAKFQPNGDIVWAKEIINSTNLSGLNPFSNIATDSDGNTHLNLEVKGTLNLDDGNVIVSSEQANFIVTYNAQGKIVDMRKSVSKTDAILNQQLIMVDKNNNIYTSGNFSGQVQFGKDNTLNGNFAGSIFIAKYASFNPVSVADNELLKTTDILSIHPNPAHSTSRISFTTTAPSRARLTLTDVLGRQTLLKEETLDAGEHSAEINTANFPAGIYVLTLEAGGQVFSQNVVIER
ncbi:MAG TPA: T9SS type A sorting domain-containing protein [Patescibacteria group bacterium]|nr:T9SS type A sorting domain-containing protein [Patescibacteria group bacterium]